MKISTKGRYGLRALTDLAAQQESGPVSLAVVAERQCISLNYLEQVFGILRRAGIVESMKGAGGGYMLSGSLSEINLREVLEILEGRFAIVDRENTDEDDPVSRSISELLWDEIDSCIQDYLEKHTMDELTDRYRKMTAERKNKK